jgi:hypothetical protein
MHRPFREKLEVVVGETLQVIDVVRMETWRCAMLVALLLEKACKGSFNPYHMV